MASYGNLAFAGHELPMAGVGAGAFQGERDETFFEHGHSINYIAARASMLQDLFVNG